MTFITKVADTFLGAFIAFFVALWATFFLLISLELFWKPILALFFIPLALVTFEHFDGYGRARNLFASWKKPAARKGVTIEGVLAS